MCFPLFYLQAHLMLMFLGTLVAWGEAQVRLIQVPQNRRTLSPVIIRGNNGRLSRDEITAATATAPAKSSFHYEVVAPEYRNYQAHQASQDGDYVEGKPPFTYFSFSKHKNQKE